MNKKSKITILLISLIFCLSAFSITAFAEDYSEEVTVPDDTVPVTSEEPVTDYYTEPVTDYVPDDTSADTTVYDNYTDYIEPVTDYAPDETVADTTDYSDGNDYNNYDDGNYTYEEYVPDFEDDDYVIEDAQPVSEAELFDVDKKVDDSELSDSDWDSIAKSLQNASNSGGRSDFSSIKNNTSADDNGLWMLITGALLIILAIVGVTYVIISSMNAKKVYAGAPGGSASKGGSHSSGASRQKSKSDYNDGYGTPRLAKKRKLDDTAEVRLPKNSGGHRYK